MFAKNFVKVLVKKINNERERKEEKKKKFNAKVYQIILVNEESRKGKKLVTLLTPLQECTIIRVYSYIVVIKNASSQHQQPRKM